MIIKASGRSALILATGLFVCFAGPSQAAAGADNAAASSKSERAAGAPIALNKYAKRGSRHGKNYAHRKSSKLALKSSAAQKAAATDVAADDGDNSSASSAIPPSVANANAQLASADTPTDKAKVMSAPASDILQNAPNNPANAQPASETHVVSADQLNDVDRALREGKPPATTQAMASADPPVAPMMASSNESSTWDQTTLIGKIFIGFGALLTMASAARMFMA
jgi:hypothetical protein